MTYKLEEFKAWLEEDEVRKDRLDWNQIFTVYRLNSSEKLKGLIEATGSFSGSEWQYCRQVALKWIAERERERAEENNAVINAQEWLESKFPSTQEKAKVKQLRTYYLTGNDEEKSPEEYWFFNVRLKGELDLSVLPNLEAFLSNLNAVTSGREAIKITKLKVGAKLNTLKITNYPALREIQGLEKCLRLVDLRIELCPNLNLVGFLEDWKREVERLKRQVGELEQTSYTSMPGSWEVESDSEETLESKITRKKQELQTALTSGRRSTAPLRKQIELLERVQGLENKLKGLEEKEQEYQRQIQGKEQEITNKQQQIGQLQSKLQSKSLSEQQAQQKIERLEQQIQNLEQEKQALTERMLSERQEALREWEREKGELETNLTKLEESKDTFQKSADYLRETLKGTEKSLEEIKRELEQTKAQIQKDAESYQSQLEVKTEDIKKREEAYGVIQERNQELEKKLSGTQSEISQLSEWISKLEAVSAEGNAFASLKKELELAQSQVGALTEELKAKKPKSYWWVWVVIGLIALYFIMG